MTSFLVIDDDRESSAVIARQLLEKKLEVRVARTDDEAVTALTERVADVVVASVDLRAPADRARLDRLRAHAPSATTIALSAQATPEDRALAEELGLAAVLGRGALDTELDAAIGRALEIASGFRGRLHGLNLHDVLQMFNLAHRTLSVFVGGRSPGRIDFDEGEIVHAVSGALIGREALAVILASSSGSVRTTPRTDTAHSIDAEFAALMLETAQQVDEKVRSSREPPAPAAKAEEDDLALDEVALSDRRPGSDDSAIPLPSFLENADVWGLGLPSVIPNGGPLLVAIPPLVVERRLDALCRALLAEIAGAMAIAILDVSNGELAGAELAFPTDRGFEQDWSRYFTALFGGAEVRALAARLDGGAYVDEAHLSTRHGHFLGRILRGGSHALLVMLPRSGDVPVAWAAVRAMVRGVETNL